MRRSWAAPLVALMTVAVLGAGCSDDDNAGDATTTTEGTTTTTTVETTTTSAESTTTTTEGLPDEPPRREDAASGSGCAPGAGALPDGWWYGSVDGPAADKQLSFDLACYYIGAAAEAEAASRGDEVSNDYYIVDETTQVRVVPVSGDATGSCVELQSTLEMVECAPEDVAGDWGVWIRVFGGTVDRLVEQYAP